MTTKYNWVIGQVETDPQSNAITKIDYTVSASNGICNASISGSVNCKEHHDEECKPLQEITLEYLINVVQESVGKDSVEASLSSSIEAQSDPILNSQIPLRFSDPLMLPLENNKP